jgi:capsular exopolysaccharide synthesis family protein
VLLGSYEWRKVVKTISDIMTGTLSTEDILQTPGIENLHILSSGTIPPNPAELIYSKAIGEFIGQVRAAYDYVLIDAPPLLAATDAALLAAKADAVVMVYRVGKVPRGVLKRAKAQLENVKANVIGVILNGLNAELSSDYAEYKYKYYYYQHKSEKTPQTTAEKIQALPALVKSYVGAAAGGLSMQKAEELRQALSATSLAGRVRKLGLPRLRSRRPDGEQKVSVAKASLLLVAVIFLVMGILYQMGYLNFALPSASAQRGHQKEVSMRMLQDAPHADFLRPAGGSRGADRQTPAPERATIHEGRGVASVDEALACPIQGV